MKRQIVLIASLVAGVLAAVLTRFYLNAKDAEVRQIRESFNRRYGRMAVLVWKRDLPSGTVLQMSDLGGLDVPEIGMRGQAVEENDWRSVVGRKLAYGRKAKDVLLWSDIEGGNPSVTGLSADVKKAMRAVSINCSGAASVAGMVKPNDHVDVIGTFDLSDPSSKQSGAKAKSLVTCTILQNVLVLATGSQTAKMQAKEFGASAYSTVTLEVTPREAEMLAFTEQIKGRLVLTLRNRNDTHYERELPQVNFDKIVGEISELNEKRQQQKYTNR